MPDHTKKFEDFVNIVRQLRSESGCPWDKEQTPETLQRYFAEETGELFEAVASGDAQHVKEELGDLFYLVILLAQLYKDADLFDIGDVLDTISEKMIRRHPHVFDDEKIKTVAELRQRWKEIKGIEKENRGKTKKN